MILLGIVQVTKSKTLPLYLHAPLLEGQLETCPSLYRNTQNMKNDI